MQVMERFVGRTGARTIFMIECIHGKAIKSHSFYKDENEIILMPGTFLRVISKWSPADDLHMIHLREEVPPYILVASPLTTPSSTESFSVKKLSIKDSPPPNVVPSHSNTSPSVTAPTVSDYDNTHPVNKSTIPKKFQQFDNTTTTQPFRKFTNLFT